MDYPTPRFPHEDWNLFSQSSQPTAGSRVVRCIPCFSSLLFSRTCYFLSYPWPPMFLHGKKQNSLPSLLGILFCRKHFRTSRSSLLLKIFAYWPCAGNQGGSRDLWSRLKCNVKKSVSHFAQLYFFLSGAPNTDGFLELVNILGVGVEIPWSSTPVTEPLTLCLEGLREME